MAGTFDALVWARKLPLPASEKALLFALVAYLDEHDSCYPSQATLAQDAGLGERTVRRYLRVWERCGLIERKARMRGEGRGRSSDRIIVRVGSTLDQAARAAAWEMDDQPAKSDDQPAAESTTNRPTNGRGTTREQPDRTRRTRSNDSKVCSRCGCETDRVGSFVDSSGHDVVCDHKRKTRKRRGGHGPETGDDPR